MTVSKAGLLCLGLAVGLTLGATGLQAQVLLIDPGTTAGKTQLPSPDVPYAVSPTTWWNRGTGGNTFGTIVYSDNSNATGVTVIADQLDNVTGSAGYNFTTSATNNAGNGSIPAPAGVFASNPVNNAVWSPVASNVGYGGIAMKIGSLSAGTYDVYVVAAYVGTATPGSLPGGGSPAQQDVWVFSDPNSTGFNTGTFGTANSRLENSTRGAWTLDNNYTKITVTVDALNPYIYVISEGAVNDSRRGWLNSVQIVPVPEPSALGLLSLGAGLFAFLRRRPRGLV